jgi:hypothetical protein
LTAFTATTTAMKTKIELNKMKQNPTQPPKNKIKNEIKRHVHNDGWRK